MSIPNRVIDIIEYQINQKNVSMTTDLIDDHNCDSLDMVEIIMQLEEEFDIEIADEEISKFRTAGDFVHYLDKVLSPYHPVRPEVNHVDFS